MWSVLFALAALAGPAPLPDVELIVVGPARPGGASLFGVREGPEAAVHVPAPPCGTATASLADLLRAAFREERPADRHRLAIEPARLEAALEAPSPSGCPSAAAALADRLDRAAQGALRRAAAGDPRASPLQARLARLRPRPLAYVWAELTAPADARARASAWAAARGDPERLLAWAARAGLLARSWSERTAPPAAARAWAWPWLTILLVGALPLAGLTVMAPRIAGPVLAAGAGALGVSARIAGGDPAGAAAAAPLLLLSVIPLARGLGAAGRAVALALGAGLFLLGLGGDGFALVLAPLVFAVSAARGRSRSGPGSSPGSRARDG